MKKADSEYVSKKEAAALLGTTPRTIQRWVDQGLLSPRLLSDQKNVMFNRVEVQALRAMREDKSTDVWSVKVIALQALATARVAEHKLGLLLEHLGLNSVPLARDEAGVQDLYAYAAEALTDQKLRSPDWVRFWAGAFFMMDEVYLELVAMHTNNDEPWRHYMDFANNVSRAGHVLGEGVTQSLSAAYKYFDAGKRHLWYVGYMACRKTHGRRIADRVFGGAKGAVDEIMAILH